MAKIFQLWFGLLFTAFVPLLVGIVFKEYQVAWLAALCGAFITIIAKPEGLAELSLGPLKAKMQKTIAEATATVEQLREVATTMATVVLSDLMAGQFMWGMSAAKRLELHDELVQNLERLGVTPEQLVRVQADWWGGIGVMYHNKLSQRLRQSAQEAKLSVHEVTQEFNAFAKMDTRSAGSPDDYQKFFTKHKLLTPDIQLWIDDYRHFLLTKEVRRRDEFAD